MKISPIGAELFHADGRKDRQRERQKYITNLMIAFVVKTRGADSLSQQAKVFGPNCLFNVHYTTLAVATAQLV
jgi:hypothetical protein